MSFLSFLLPSKPNPQAPQAEKGRQERQSEKDSLYYDDRRLSDCKSIETDSTHEQQAGGSQPSSPLKDLRKGYPREERTSFPPFLEEFPQKPLERFSFSDFQELWQRPEALQLRLLVKKFIQEISPKSVPRHEQSESFQDFLLYMEEIIPMNPIWREASDAEIDHAIEGIEKYILLLIFDRVFPPLNSEEGKVDVAIQQQIQKFNWVQPRHFDVSWDECYDPYIKNAQEELSRINSYKSPRDKIVCILNCCKIISTIISKSGQRGGADTFFPMLIYVTMKANPSRLHSNCQFIQKFRYHPKLRSETGYYITNLQGAAFFIEQLTVASLTLSEEEMLLYPLPGSKKEGFFSSFSFASLFTRSPSPSPSTSFSGSARGSVSGSFSSFASSTNPSAAAAAAAATTFTPHLNSPTSSPSRSSRKSTSSSSKSKSSRSTKSTGESNEMNGQNEGTVGEGESANGTGEGTNECSETSESSHEGNNEAFMEPPSFSLSSDDEEDFYCIATSATEEGEFPSPHSSLKELPHLSLSSPSLLSLSSLSPLSPPPSSNMPLPSNLHLHSSRTLSSSSSPVSSFSNVSVGSENSEVHSRNSSFYGGASTAAYLERELHLGFL